MRIDEAFDILGIEIAKDKKKIKAAFAKKVRECPSLSGSGGR